MWDAEKVNGPGRQRGAVLGLALIAVMVAGFVYLSVQPQWASRSMAEVIGATDSSTLDVTVNHNRCGNGGPRVNVTRQSADSIVLSAEQDERGNCDDIGLTSIVTVKLGAALGQRAIRFQPEQQVGSVVCILDGERSDQCR